MGQHDRNIHYRYGFNDKEQDNDVKGIGNQVDYGLRIYDPRIGRFLSVDPLTKSYPMLTPYQYASNRPIDGIDLDGLEWQPVNEKGENVALNSNDIKDYKWVGYEEKYKYKGKLYNSLDDLPAKANKQRANLVDVAPAGTVSFARIRNYDDKGVYTSLTVYDNTGSKNSYNTDLTSNLTVSDKIWGFIGAEEGYNHCYDYSLGDGMATIGYGTAVPIANENPLYVNDGITIQMAKTLLKNEVLSNITEFQKSYGKERMTQFEFDALISVYYNRGGPAFQRSKMVKIVFAKDVSQNIIDNTFATAFRRSYPGLPYRRKREGNMFSYGQYSNKDGKHTEANWINSNNK